MNVKMLKRLLKRIFASIILIFSVYHLGKVIHASHCSEFLHIRDQFEQGRLYTHTHRLDQNVGTGVVIGIQKKKKMIGVSYCHNVKFVIWQVAV